MTDLRMFVGFSDSFLGRVPRAKIRIVNAVLELVENQDFDKITVKDICEAAGISKTTFYQHFSSKYDILHWHYDLVSDAGTRQIGRTLSWEDGHLITSAGIASALPLYNAASSSEGQEGLVPYSARKRKADIHETLTEYRHVEITPKLEFQITALCAGEQAAVYEFFEEIATRSVYELAEYMVSIVPKDLFEAMQLTEPKPDRQWDNPWTELYSM